MDLVDGDDIHARILQVAAQGRAAGVDFDARSQRVVAAGVGEAEAEEPTTEVKEMEKGSGETSDV